MDFCINDRKFCADFEKSAMDEIAAALRGGARVGVACSGGADSVFALLAMLDIFGGFGGSFAVLHFNHKARETAERDERFVRELCERLGVKFVSEAAHTFCGTRTETEFREMRLDFFKTACAAENIAVLVQGHHLGDAAETVIMRLCRGAGTAGLSAPAPVSRLGGMVFARPLLTIAKAEIKSMLSSAGVGWCEDETNAQNVHLRNEIRNGVLPLLERLPNFYRGVARSQRLLREDASALDELFAEFFNPASAASDEIPLPPRLLETRAFLRRAVAAVLSAHGLSEKIRASAVDAFLDDISAAAVSKNKRAKTSAGEMTLEFSSADGILRVFRSAGTGEFCIESGLGKVALPDGRSLSIKKITLGSEKRAAILAGQNDDSVRAYLDISCFGDIKKDALTIRSRRNGDAYAPIGRKTPKKIKELLNAKKVPISKRSSVFVVCNKKGEILWVPPAACADKYRLTNSSVALELTLLEQ